MKRSITEEDRVAVTNIQLRHLQRQIQTSVKRGDTLRGTRQQLIDRCLLHERDHLRLAASNAFPLTQKKQAEALPVASLYKLLCGETAEDIVFVVLRLLGPLELFMLARVSRQLFLCVARLLPRLVQDLSTYIQEREGMDMAWRQLLSADAVRLLQHGHTLAATVAVTSESLDRMAQFTLRFYLLYRCDRNALICTLTQVARPRLPWQLLFVYNKKTGAVRLLDTARAQYSLLSQWALHQAIHSAHSLLQERYDFDVSYEAIRLQQQGTLHQLDLLAPETLRKLLVPATHQQHLMTPSVLVCPDAENGGGVIPLVASLIREDCVLYTVGGWQMERYYTDYHYRFVDYYECRLYINLAESDGLHADSKALITNNPRRFLKDAGWT